jgi:hypothetical protein
MQVEEDKANGLGSIGIPPAGSEKGSVLDAVVAVVNAQMDADRKTTALKALQVCRDVGGGYVLPLIVGNMVVMYSL